MSNVELKINMKSDFLVYKPFDASRISILLGQKKLNKEIYEKLIHYRIEKNIGADGMINIDIHFYQEFSNMAIKKTPIDILKSLNVNIITFCKQSLNQGYYVFLPIETNRISKYLNYEKDSFYHHILLHGYNDEDNVFHGADFFSFSRGKYGAKQVSYDELEDAFYTLQEITKTSSRKDESNQWLKDIELLYCYEKYNDHFILDNIIQGLKYFLDERDCYGNKNYTQNEFYGYAIYDLILEHLKSVAGFENTIIDFRCISLLFNRFSYMKKQIIYIEEQLDHKIDLKEIYETYSDLEKKSKEVFTRSVKYNFNYNGDMIHKIEEQLSEIKISDYGITDKYIKVLEISRGGI